MGVSVLVNFGPNTTCSSPQLEVKSLFTNLLRLPAMLKTRLPLECLPDGASSRVTMATGGSCLLVGSASGPLHSLSLHVSPATKSATVAVLHS